MRPQASSVRSRCLRLPGIRGEPLLGRRVLVVEDEMVIAMLLKDMLEELGCKVVATAARPLAAISAMNYRPSMRPS
jgi:hypothetical protein